MEMVNRLKLFSVVFGVVFILGFVSAEENVFYLNSVEDETIHLNSVGKEKQGMV